MASNAPHEMKHRKVLRFQDRQRFPESNSFYRQLQLLVRGSLPLARQKAKNRLREWRAAFANLILRLRQASEKRRIHPLVYLSAGTAVAVIAVFNLLYTTATTVSIDGVELGAVASEAEAQAARASVEENLSAVLGYDYTIEDSVVSYSYSTGLTARSALVDESVIEEALSNSIHVVEHGYALYVNGEFVGATQTKGALEGLLDQVAADYRNENTVSVEFVEGVEVRECDLPVEDFTNLADVALRINDTKEGEVTYTVEKGDVWSVIAQDHNMTSAELLALNPGYDIDRLSIGDVLSNSNAVPFLTVFASQMEY